MRTWTTSSIFNQFWKAHADHLHTVLTRVRDVHLTLSPTKCQFAAADLDYLGHHIGLGRIQPCLNKAEALPAYPATQNKKQLQSFLGLSGYYRKSSCRTTPTSHLFIPTC